jgi:hypothetical protein
MMPHGKALDSGSARAGAVISSALAETSSFSFFTTTVSSCEGAVAEDGSRTELRATLGLETMTPRGKMEARP